MERKLEYIFYFDIDKYKKYYFYYRYCDLAFFLAKMDRININYKKLDKKILETETKIFCFYYQYKLFFRCLRKLGDREARNIEDIQKIKKKTEFCGNAILGFFVFDNLFFIISEADCALAAVSEK